MHNVRRVGWAGLMLLIALASASTLAWGHSEPPPPPPPPPLEGREVQAVEPLRWSWLHWWEANRALYLVLGEQAGDDQDADAFDADAARARAVVALSAGLRDPAMEVREACALALGRMGAAETVPTLIDQLAVEPSERVRHRVLVALSLLGGDEAEAFLLSHVYASDHLRATGLLGLRFIRPLSVPAVEGLDQAMNGPALVANAASEALAADEPALPLVELKARVASAASPWIAARLIRALGYTGDEQTDALLLDSVVDGPRFQQLAAWRLLQDIAVDKERAAAWLRAGGQRQQIANALVDWREAHRRLVRLAPEPTRPDDLPALEATLDLDGIERQRTPITGIERIYQARLRASAVLALIERRPPRTGTALRRLVAEERSMLLVPRAYATIGIGELGEREGLIDLVSMLRGGDIPRREASVPLADNSPLRGFAAIGIGLYCRPVDAEQGSADRPGHDKAAALLIDHLNDPRETLEVRTACALALGLTRRSAYLPALADVSAQLDPFDDTTLLGYVLLSRALLGDATLLPEVERFLHARENRDEMSNLLGRRAAVLALGVTRSREAVPLLVWAWDQPYYINREVITALSLSGALGVGDDLIERLEQAPSEFERAYMAQALGALFVPERPTPLDRVLINQDFTMRDGLMEDLRTLDNRFLMHYLIPQFEEPWY